MATMTAKRQGHPWPATLAALAVATGAALPASGDEALGEVNFPVSCSAAVQAAFNHAMAQYHSFWFGPARQSFTAILDEDPGCGVAHWGIALVALGNPFGWPAGADTQARAAAALDEARRVGAASPRERGLTEALGAYLSDFEQVPHRTRVLALERAMAQLAERYPDDVEIQILYALVLNAAVDPTDKRFARQRQAAAILEPLFERYPRHPGVAHYLIHTYDYAELAEQALPAARVYSSIAPEVPHALHMPTHIYARLGLWPEMVAGNYASLQAAEAELGEHSFGPGVYDALHALDYLVFGHLQQAQDRAAAELAGRVAAIRVIDVQNFVAAYAFAAIPARQALERGDWAGAAALELAPATLPWERFPQAEAILVFARGLGAARAGDTDAADGDLDRLRALRLALQEAGNDYWAGQVAFQADALAAWIELARGRQPAALRLMRAAADAEDASDKHPVTPGNVVPSRELLGEMLLVLDRPAEALVEFERSLVRDPDRFRGLWGAARAAEAAARADLARSWYARLLEVAAERDTERPEIVHALAFMARGS